jgi:hypothetical protein
VLSLRLYLGQLKKESIRASTCLCSFSCFLSSGLKIQVPHIPMNTGEEVRPINLWIVLRLESVSWWCTKKPPVGPVDETGSKRSCVEEFALS